MFSKKAILGLLIVLSMATGLNAQSKGTIVYALVMDTVKVDPETGEWPDMLTIHALEDAGYEVIKFYNDSLSYASEATLDTLYNADLIVLGRSTPSLNYADPHKETWNSIPTPILNLEMWSARSSRLNWFNTTSMVSVANDDDVVVNAVIDEPGDVVFEEVDFDPTASVPWIVGSYDAIGTTDAGYGTLIAKLESDETVLFARFEPEVDFYAGAGDFPAGYRTLLGNGRDVSGAAPFDYYNFTDQSEQVFFAEVANLIALGGGPHNAVKKEKAQPTSCSLAQNYPNPFNPTTNIEFTLSKAGHTTLQVFNIEGKLVATLVDNQLDAGLHTVHFAADNLSAGIYYYSIRHDSFTDVKKMILIK